MKSYVALIEKTLIHNVKMKSKNPFEPIKVLYTPKEWECLGVGNYAAVFLHHSNKDWVVKIYARNLEGLEKEAEVYQRLGHHPAYSQLVYKGENFLVLKRLKGITLYNAVTKGVRIPEQVIIDINQALDYARSQGLTPVDVHGKNVMMNDGKGYIVDISDFYKEKEDEKWNDIVKAYYKFYRKTLYKFPVKIPLFVLDLVRHSYRIYTYIRKKYKKKSFH
ncbi:serine/threonine protein kinase [Domibacillus indicus]|uniref:serine/threonine protein kinase n=1 Tax=Domibacillus indicus TaxID=1437523 RepID=UPI00203A53DB|nr:serine/threonine protein kinase [Domibacillus indicus]MCM3789529.1 serine/threonine protein kinase [Domibacillus indicus]